MLDLFLHKDAFDLSPVPLIILGRGGKNKLYANPAFEALGISDVAAVASFADCESQEAKAVSLIDGKFLDVSAQACLWNGTPAQALWCHDVTATIEKQEGLQTAIANSDRILETKSNFLATMSHEMRTPMQSVFGLLELIVLERPSQNILEMAGIAKNSASAMLDIMDDILDLAKIDAEKMELDMFEIPVRTLVRGVIEALSVKILGKPVDMIDSIGEDVPAVVIGDPKRLRQVLVNLTGNALKFTERGRVTLKVSSQATGADTVTIRFEITDTGIGMSEDVQKKLFSSFTQADNSTARKYGGTGLGLSISKKLVDLMGGRIGVESKSGEGSTFWFEIPTRAVTASAGGLSNGQGDMPDLSGLSVISVEAHPQAAKEISSSLRSMGATVDSCATSAEALTLIARRPFDVGIVDQGLPDGLGLDLIRGILDIRPAMGVFMYTVRDDSGLQAALHSLGVDYVAKPASRLGLGQKVLEAASRVPHRESEGPKKLLIAEDTPSIQDLLKRQLAILGVDADFAGNGREALDALETGLYGIVLSDLHMPEMDGYALARAIRDSPHEAQRLLPVIVLTADVQMAQRETYLKSGFDECLLKPVSLGHLKRLLIRWGLLQPGEFLESLPAPAIDTPSSGVIDMTMLAEQMGDFDDGAKDMLGLFVDFTRPLMEKLTAAAEKSDAAALAEAAHSLKGAARSACAPTLGNIAAKIQERAEKNEIDRGLVEAVLAEFDVTARAIEDLVRA